MEKELQFLQRVIQELQAEAHHAIIHEQYDRAIGLIYAIKQQPTQFEEALEAIMEVPDEASGSE